MYCYMQGPGFEPWTPHLFTLQKTEFYSLDYLTKKKLLLFTFQPLGTIQIFLFFLPSCFNMLYVIVFTSCLYVIVL